MSVFHELKNSNIDGQWGFLLAIFSIIVNIAVTEKCTKRFALYLWEISHSVIHKMYAVDLEGLGSKWLFDISLSKVKEALCWRQ